MTEVPRLTLVAAVAENGVIGRDGDLPWRLSDDLQHFKSLTHGHPILMGRKTWESIGRPLPGRRNLVVSRQPEYVAEGAEVFSSIEEALAAVGEGDVFVIGGAGIYAAALPHARRLVLTEVHAMVEGDVHFPDWTRDGWHEVSREAHSADDRNDHAFDVVVYEVG